MSSEIGALQSGQTDFLQMAHIPIGDLRCLEGHHSELLAKIETSG